jgi:hypothetical protein
VEVRFICKCNECGNRFDIGNNDKWGGIIND